MVNLSKAPKNTQLTGNIGLYLCCYELSKLGWNVMPTARNAKGVDIIAYNFDASVTLAIQVKATTLRKGIRLGKNPEPPMGDLWMVTLVEPSGLHQIHLMKPGEVWEGKVEDAVPDPQSWLPYRAYAPHLNRWDLLDELSKIKRVNHSASWQRITSGRHRRQLRHRTLGLGPQVFLGQFQSPDTESPVGAFALHPENATLRYQGPHAGHGVRG